MEASAHEPVRNWIMMKIRAGDGADFFLFWAVRQDFTQIYGQSLRFFWFVRKQNAFYGQTAIFKWFVRKFLAIMMGIYG